MKLASYNIQFGRGPDGQFDLQRIADDIGAADLIALQEVETHCERSGMVHQPQVLADIFADMHWVFGPGIDLDASTTVGNQPVHRRRQFGNMVLSRWPILSSISHTLPKIALHGFFHSQRILLETVIDAPGAPLRFFSVHLDHVSADTRMPQVRYLQEVVMRGHERGACVGGVVSDDSWLDRPMPPQPTSAIVMGDMNFLPTSLEYATLLGDLSETQQRTTRAHGLLDAWTLAGHDELSGDTVAIGTRSNRRIDHCFVTTDLADSVQSMAIGTTATGSDHLPIFVQLAR